MFRIERIGNDGETYLTRIHLTPWKHWFFKQRLYLHIFHRPDADRHPHDHPFAFRSIVLWGGYDEIVSDPSQMVKEVVDGKLITHAKQVLKPREWLANDYVEADFRHIISTLHRSPTVTLVIRGEKTRDWGFWVPEENGERFELWTDYLNCDPEPSAYGAKKVVENV